MSLRTRLFLALSGLVAALVVGQWWMMTSLSRELDRELDTVALAVGGTVASFFSFDESGHASGHVVMDAAEISDRLSEHLSERHAHTAVLPDPAELAEMIGTEGGPRRQTVVIRREFDLHSAGTVGEEGDDASSEMRWLVETLEDDDGRFRYTYRHSTGDGDDTGSDLTAPIVRQFVLPDDLRSSGQTAGESVVVLKPAGEADVEGEWQPVEADVRIHIERSPQARFLRLVGPEAQARVPLPEAGLDEKFESFRRRMLFGSGAVLLLGLVLSAALAHRVSAPLRRLASAAEEVGGGALGAQVDESAGDREVRATLGAFNRMSSRLAELDARARKLSALRHLGEIGDVARGLAHTLRNPLNALGLSVEELASRAADPDSRPSDAAGTEGLAQSARRQIQRMDRGIRSFLVLASPSGSQAEAVDVAGLAQDVALEALQDGGGRVRVTVDAESPATVGGVEAELRAVLQALVVNAVEATVEAGSSDEVEVRVEPVGEAGTRIEILDRGPGLADEVRQRLFTPHVSTKASGSGMGLFLAHRLATERYGGDLELLDREGGGTVAVLTLNDRVDPENPDAEVPRSEVEQ